MGFIIDREGLHISEKKTIAIDKATNPKNVKELQSFLGSINYFARFIKNMSTILNPLYNLLKSNVKWHWSDKCVRAFQEVKEILKTAPVLVHYNPELEVSLTVDASAVGIGAILTHKLPSGEEKPIAFASRTLSEAEKKYSQIEKEGLAIIFGVLKFHQYLYLKKFKLVTDHKPLLTIFGDKKSIPQFSANRLRRWAVILSGYNYVIEYVQSSKNNADWLSRMPPSDNIDNFGDDHCDIDYCYFLSKSSDFNLSFEKIEKETTSDRVLQQVIFYINKGWPKSVKDDCLKPYFIKRYELLISVNCTGKII